MINVIKLNKTWKWYFNKYYLTQEILLKPFENTSVDLLKKSYSWDIQIDFKRYNFLFNAYKNIVH